MAWKPSVCHTVPVQTLFGFLILSLRVSGLRQGASWYPERSKPGSACQMIITPVEWFAFASSKVSCSHCRSAVLRRSNSEPGSLVLGSVSQRLLHEPWTFSVANVTLWNVQPRVFARRRLGV